MGIDLGGNPLQLGLAVAVDAWVYDRQAGLGLPKCFTSPSGWRFILIKCSCSVLNGIQLDAKATVRPGDLP